MNLMAGLRPGVVVLLSALAAAQTPRIEDPVARKGVKWLLEAQAKSGAWFGSDGRRSDKKWVAQGKAHEHLVTTSLAMSTLLEAGLPASHPSIRKARAWILARPGTESGLIAGKHAMLWGHAFAVEALSLLLARGPDVAVEERVLGGVSLLITSQTYHGAWAYRPMSQVDPDITISAVAVRALSAAKRAGAPVPKEVFRRARLYAEKRRIDNPVGPRGQRMEKVVPDGFTYDHLEWTRVTYASTACAASILATDAKAYAPVIRKAALLLVDHEPWQLDRRRGDVFAWFGRMMAQDAIDASGDRGIRRRHRDRVRAWLRHQQRKDGCWRPIPLGPGVAFHTAAAVRVWLDS